MSDRLASSSRTSFRAPTATGELLNPIFAPDGQSIAYFAQNRDGSGIPNVLRRIPITGGTPSTMASLTVPFGASWGTEGVLVGQGRGGIVLVSPTGKAPERVVSVAPDEWAHGPQMLPGGRTVLFTLAKGSGDDRWENAQVVAQSLADGTRRVLIERLRRPIFAERTPGVRSRGNGVRGVLRCSEPHGDRYARARDRGCPSRDGAANRNVSTRGIDDRHARVRARAGLRVCDDARSPDR